MSDMAAGTLLERMRAAPRGTRELSDEYMRALGWRVVGTHDDMTSHGSYFWVMPGGNYGMPHCSRLHPTHCVREAEMCARPVGYDRVVTYHGGSDQVDVRVFPTDGGGVVEETTCDPERVALIICIAELRRLTRRREVDG